MRCVKASIDIAGLDAYIDRRVREAVAEALGEHPKDDPWLNSGAAAEYLGVKRQRIHDLVCAGDLPRLREKGDESSRARASRKMSEDAKFILGFG